MKSIGNFHFLLLRVVDITFQARWTLPVLEGWLLGSGHAVRHHQLTCSTCAFWSRRSSKNDHRMTQRRSRGQNISVPVALAGTEIIRNPPVPGKPNFVSVRTELLTFATEKLQTHFQSWNLTAAI